MNNKGHTMKKFNESMLFEIGKTYHRQKDLHDKFGGNRQSGIAPCAKHPYVFLFTSRRGIEFGYEDGWISSDIFGFTGEGQVGNMVMARGNRAIRDHQEQDRELHLFKRTNKGKYEYLGQFEYIRHEINPGQDGENKTRDVIKFVLKRIVF